MADGSVEAGVTGGDGRRPASPRERILAVFRDGSPDERAAFVNACPRHPLREGAATLSQSDDPVHRVMALAILTTAYCYGRACALGTEIALAGHALGSEALRGGGADLQPATLSGLAVGGVSSLRRLGRGGEALVLCERLLRYHESLDAADPNLHSLRMARVELLLDLDRVDDAEAAFREAPAPAGIATLDARRLAARIEDSRRRGSTSVPG